MQLTTLWLTPRQSKGIDRPNLAGTLPVINDVDQYNHIGCLIVRFVRVLRLRQWARATHSACKYSARFYLLLRESISTRGVADVMVDVRRDGHLVSGHTKTLLSRARHRIAQTHIPTILSWSTYLPALPAKLFSGGLLGTTVCSFRRHDGQRLVPRGLNHDPKFRA
jgi:hypothetical protein